MRIEFKIKASCGDALLHINTATFQTSGQEVTIDRESTIVDGEYMQWRSCYVWDGLTENYKVPELTRFVSLEMEEEAPDLVKCEVTNCWVDGEEIPVG